MARKGPRADHDAGLHPRCLDCGSTGGAITSGGNNRSYRTRGLCCACYSWHRDHGTRGKFRRKWDLRIKHPAIPRQYLDPYMLGCTRDQHAVMPGGHELARRLFLEAEVFAAAFLASKALEAA